MAGQIIDHYASPQELTNYARLYYDKYMGFPDFLANQFLPDLKLQDIEYSYSQGFADVVENMGYRGYDTEAEFMGRQGQAAQTRGAIQPLGGIFRLSEYDRLRLQINAEDKITQAIYDDVETAVRAYAVKLEIMRAQSIDTGTLTINDGSFKMTQSWGRDGSLTSTAGKVWTDPTADIMTDIFNECELMRGFTGVYPGVIVIGRALSLAILQNNYFKQAVYPLVPSANLAGIRIGTDQISAILASQGLPPLLVQNKAFRIKNLANNNTNANNFTVVPTFNPNKAYFLPAPVSPTSPESSTLGFTAVGIAPTSLEPAFHLVSSGPEAPGITAAVQHLVYPAGLFTIFDAVAMPVLAGPNHSAVFTVATGLS